jgi:hypothetical protein
LREVGCLGRLERLGDMSGEELVQLVSEAKQAQRKEMELAGYMQEAGEQLLRADYAGAMRKFKEVLEVDPDNEEAKRGHQEAEKGERLASMSPEELEAAVMGGMDSTSLVQALGVTEGREASATAKQFDPTKKLPKRVPHHPDKPYDAGIKGPTFFTVCWCVRTALRVNPPSNTPPPPRPPRPASEERGGRTGTSPRRTSRRWTCRCRCSTRSSTGRRTRATGSRRRGTATCRGRWSPRPPTPMGATAQPRSASAWCARTHARTHARSQPAAAAAAATTAACLAPSPRLASLLTHRWPPPIVIIIIIVVVIVVVVVVVVVLLSSAAAAA